MKFSIEKEFFKDPKTGAKTSYALQKFSIYYHWTPPGEKELKKDYIGQYDGDPFGNCQTAAIPRFNGLISYLRYNYETIGGANFTEDEIKAAVKSLITAIQNGYGKRQVIVDVHREYVAFIKKYFPEIMLNTPYVNSTGSNMNIILIKLY